MKEFLEKRIPSIEKGTERNKLEGNPIIVEIGTASSLRWTSRAIQEKINNGAKYIGVDINESNLRDLKEDGKSVVVGDMMHLPLKNSSANEIWALNVFGENVDYFYGQPTDTMSGKMFSFNKSLEELARVIKSDGKIIIGETMTPAAKLLNLDYAKFGFEKKVFMREKLEEFLKENGMPIAIATKLNMSRQGQPSFFLELTKKEK